MQSSRPLDTSSVPGGSRGDRSAKRSARQRQLDDLESRLVAVERWQTRRPKKKLQCEAVEPAAEPREEEDSASSRMPQVEVSQPSLASSGRVQTSMAPAATDAATDGCIKELTSGLLDDTTSSNICTLGDERASAHQKEHQIAL